MSSWNWKGYKYSSKNPHVGRSGSPIPATVGKARAWERKNNPTKVATMERAALQSRIAAAKKNPFGKSRVKKLEIELASVKGGGAKPTESSGMDTFVKSFKYDEAIRRYKKLHGKIPTVDQLENFVEADKMLAAADKQDRADEAKEAQEYARVAKRLGVSAEHAKKLVSQFDKNVGQGKQPEKGSSKVLPQGWEEAMRQANPKPKKVSLKGAPRPELPKKSDPEYKAKLSKFRKWYTANRAKPKKKKVVLTKAAPVKTAPAKAAPKKVASSIPGLRARIAQKRKTGQRIPKAWLKAERMEDLNVINENLAEVERGKRDMAKWRKGRAETLGKHAKHKARMRQMVADAKSQAAAQNKKYREDKAKAAQVAESKRKMEAIKQRKTDAQARLAKMKADRAAQKKKNMRATMSALPGFRR